jgi:hypothetical protein
MSSCSPLGNPRRPGKDEASPLTRNRATEEQKRVGSEMAVRIEKIIATALQEAHERQTQEVGDTLSEEPQGFYRSYPD